MSNASRNNIDPAVSPSGTGCVECNQHGGWWFHLRRCALCGHIGCCDSSPRQHARAHFHESGHAVIQSFEPGEDWFWDFAQEAQISGPTLAPPDAHPASQTVPGPRDRVPRDWFSQLHR